MCGSAWQAAHSVFSPRKSTAFGAAFPLALPVPFGFEGAEATSAFGLWQAAQASGPCFPSRGNFVFTLWSNGAPFQPVSLWQAEQSWGKSPLWASLWQAEQGAGFSFTFAAGWTWHLRHGTSACLPTSGEPLRAWSNRSTFHPGAIAAWQALQSVPIDSLWGFRWQSVHTWNLRPFQVLPTWHFSQRTVRWAPSSWKAALEWSKSLTVSLKETVTAWQVMQAAPSFPMCGSWWQEAHSGLAVRNERVLWHLAHCEATGACFPSRGKPASRAWSKDLSLKWRMSASRPPCSTWHRTQSLPAARWTPFFAAIRSATGLWHSRHRDAETCFPFSWHFSQFARPSSFVWAFERTPGETSLPSCAAASCPKPAQRTIRARKGNPARETSLVFDIAAISFLHRPPWGARTGTLRGEARTGEAGTRRRVEPGVTSGIPSTVETVSRYFSPVYAGILDTPPESYSRKERG